MIKMQKSVLFPCHENTGIADQKQDLEEHKNSVSMIKLLRTSAVSLVDWLPIYETLLRVVGIQ